MKEYIKKVVDVMDSFTPTGAKNFARSEQTTSSISPNKSLWLRAIKARWDIDSVKEVTAEGACIVYYADTAILQRLKFLEILLEKDIMVMIKEESGLHETWSRTQSVQLKKLLYNEFFQEVMSVTPVVVSLPPDECNDEFE